MKVYSLKICYRHVSVQKGGMYLTWAPFQRMLSIDWICVTWKVILFINFPQLSNILVFGFYRGVGSSRGADLGSYSRVGSASGATLGSYRRVGSDSGASFWRLNRGPSFWRLNRRASFWRPNRRASFWRLNKGPFWNWIKDLFWSWIKDLFFGAK